MSESPARKLRVLWATDASAPAHNAVPFLRNAILPATERLVVLTVAPHSFLSGARPDPAFLTNVSPAAKRKAMVEAEQTAREEAALLDPEGVAVETVARWGNPIEEVLRASRTIPADLIILGAKGHSNLGMLLLGSVAQGIVHHATRPVLIARAGELQLKRILIGYDGSPPARRALEYLDKLAISPDVVISVVHVIEPFAVPASMPVGYREQAIAEARRINEQLHRHAERGMRAVTDKLTAAGRKVETQIVTGPAGPELDDLAHKQDADLIVVGSRKPSPDQHYLLGSTAEKLVRHSHVSVLVVR